MMLVAMWIYSWVLHFFQVCFRFKYIVINRDDYTKILIILHQLFHLGTGDTKIFYFAPNRMVIHA